MHSFLAQQQNVSSGISSLNQTTVKNSSEFTSFNNNNNLAVAITADLQPFPIIEKQQTSTSNLFYYNGSVCVKQEPVVMFKKECKIQNDGILKQ